MQQQDAEYVLPTATTEVAKQIFCAITRMSPSNQSILNELADLIMIAGRSSPGFTRGIPSIGINFIARIGPWFTLNPAASPPID